MDFEAGQFVVLVIGDLSGGRAYSMVNFDNSTAKVAFVMKRKPGGGFSDWLFARKDDEVQSRGFWTAGRAIFRPEEGKNIVCIGRFGHSRDDVDPRVCHAHRSFQKL